MSDIISRDGGRMDMSAKCTDEYEVSEFYGHSVI